MGQDAELVEDSLSMERRVPIVSVLIPSRERPELLKESVLSLGNGNFEVLVAIDDDDPRKKEYELLEKTLSFRLIVTKPYGYAYLERYYNDLARISTGNWLMLWNDDATIAKGWLRVLAKQDHDEPWVAQFGDEKCFPIISRTLYGIMGHFSLGPSNDTYLLGVGDRADIRLYLRPIAIHHRRDEIHDVVEGMKNQATSLVSKRQASEECVSAQDKDAEGVKVWQTIQKSVF